MMNDISVYKNTKRNETCPCGSGKTFKKCCMSEYRKMKKSLANAKVSSFTPIPPLSEDEKALFVKFYQSLLLFSFKHRSSSEKIDPVIVNEESKSFLSQQRDYFYQNIDEVIADYIEAYDIDDEKLDILNSLKDAKYDYFYVLSKTKESAVLMDENELLYNIQALHSPLDKVLDIPFKYILVKTALIPFKNRYISDGLFAADSVSKETESHLDKIPLTNPMMHYNKENKLLNIPLMLHFSLSCNINKFEKMEKIVLKKIPHSFTQGLIDLFENPYAYKVNFISSFLRSTDLSSELNCEEGDQVFSYIVGGSPVMNFEHGSKTDVISYNILERFYRQKRMAESISRASYDRAKERGFLQNLFSEYSSFYTMLGIVHIEEEYLDELDHFLKDFDTKEKRKTITEGLENLFAELSAKNGFDIHPVFLGIGTDLDSIYREIETYRDYMRLDGSGGLDRGREYSLTKGK